VSLAGKNQLHRPLRVRKETDQAFRIVQQEIGSLVRRESTGKSNRKDIFPEYVGDIGVGTTFSGELVRIAPAYLREHRIPRPSTHVPQFRVGQLANVIRERAITPPTIWPASFGPKGVGFGRIPGRDMDPVCN
jgi:hypothetical protein